MFKVEYGTSRADAVPRAATVDVKDAVDIYPAVPKPRTVDVKEVVDIYPAVPRP